MIGVARAPDAIINFASSPCGKEGKNTQKNQEFLAKEKARRSQKKKGKED